MFKLMKEITGMFDPKPEGLPDAEPRKSVTKRKRALTRATESPESSLLGSERDRTLSPTQRRCLKSLRDSKDCIPKPRNPSPCPFSPVLPPALMEPFPDFKDEYESLEPYDPHHCNLHCPHHVCKSLRKLDEKNHIAPKPCIHNDRHAPPIFRGPFNLSRIPSLSRRSFAATKRAYGLNDKAGKIRVELTSAIALVQKLRDEKRLDFCCHLLSHPHYTWNAVYKRSQFQPAAHAADALVDKLLEYLRCMLSRFPTLMREVTIAQLEKEMQDFMYLEVLWWAAEWCLCKAPSKKDSERKRGSMLRRAMVTALVQRSEGKQRRGVDLVMNRADEVVNRVMGVLVWWDGVNRDVEIEEEEFEGSVGSVETVVGEWNDGAFSEPSSGSNHDSDVEDGEDMW
ncbi:predicted protein [Pyrenophora tritici-repentis Pt-1C-BFP]|uniref:MADS-box domain-containing protein n=1 Tax=Pyrenophora tritici-repentis (strain Pt-1C-BFP) TaxID=426418 RepID=B2WKY9_PYRTR|nr:uncharacterized protein PTRG_10649 [Pyrenophora tritici-repentis Pt-1C-BFP]EDU43699.1 predicted protein [Pyrenophora tritici-repentis Pt-1C-BFP]